MRTAYAAVVLLTIAPPVWACTFPPPARVRTSIPADGDSAVPTSIRVRVTYATGAHAETLCGPKPGPPILRPATTPADGGVPDAGVPVDGGTTLAGNWIMATDVDPHYGVIWESRAAQPLAPNTAYELVDTWPDNCDCTLGPCQATPAAVFARFTTGAGPDTTKPTYGGLVGTSCSRVFCAANDDVCCGPYDHFDYSFVGKKDEADDNLVGVHLYVRRDGDNYDFTHPVAPMVLSDPVDSPVANSWSMTLTAGKYFVIARAFDSSGNEDDDPMTPEVSFVFPLAKDPLCAAIPLDAGVPVDLVYSPDIAGINDDLSVAPPDMGTSGCSCAVAGAPARRPLGLLAAAALALLILRRARRRSRRAATGGTP